MGSHLTKFLPLIQKWVCSHEERLNYTRGLFSKGGEFDVTTFNLIIHYITTCYINYLVVLDYFIFNSIINIVLEIMFLQVLPIL